MAASAQSSHLPRRLKLIYGSADSGFSLLASLLMFYFAYFLLEVARVPPDLAAAALFVGRIGDFVGGPLIGAFTDRVRTRWGRRRVFLLFVPPFLALSFALLWQTPPFNSPFWQAAYVAAALLFFDTCYSLLLIPYTALTPELTPDYDERTSINSYRMAYSILFGLVAVAIGAPETIGQFFPDPRLGYAVLAVGCGIFAALPPYLVGWTVRERPLTEEARPLSVVASIQAVAANVPFRFALALYVICWATIDLVAALLPLLLLHWFGMGEHIGLILGLILLSAVCWLPAWVWASGRWGKDRAYEVGAAILAVLLVAVAALPREATQFVYPLAVLAGFGVSMAHVIPWSIIPDVVDYGEWTTGRREEGAYYSLVDLAQKVAALATVPLAIFVLGLSGYVAGQPVLGAALVALRLLTGLAPAALLLVGIGIALFYPVSRKRQAAIQEDLRRRKAA